MHEEQAATVADGTVVPLDGEHYLRHTHTPQIVDAFRSWERERPSLAE
ncbi:hypothetical protein [Microbacterium oxydans]|nr:hypothetical protein [Microbacterium oxydans]